MFLSHRKIHLDHPKFWYARLTQCKRCYKGQYCSYSKGKQLRLDRFFVVPGTYGKYPNVEYE